jgi:hypothetical protein
MLYLLGAIAGAILNRVRGGWWLELVDLSRDSAFRGAGVWLPAAVILACLLPHGYIAAGAIALLYVFGESIGWTKWVWGISGLRDANKPGSGVMTQEVWNIAWYRVDDTGQSDGIDAIASLFVKENQNYWWYCFIGMVLRGVYWWAPMYAAMWWFEICKAPSAVLCVLVLSFLFPVVYWAAARISLAEMRYLERAEFLYGALYGLVFVYAVLHG